MYFTTATCLTTFNFLSYSPSSVSGSEAMFADLGHFSQLSIKVHN